MIPFKVKKLTETAKLPERNAEGDLWDLFADDFDLSLIKGWDQLETNQFVLLSQRRILVKTGLAIELPIKFSDKDLEKIGWKESDWIFKNQGPNLPDGLSISLYAVADIRPRSGLALKHGTTVLNTPGTIDNSYRKEIGVILYNAGHEPYKIKKGDKIAQMLIRPLYPSSFEVVEDFEDTGRGAYGSSGR